MKQLPEWINSLEPEDLQFIKNFTMKSGSLKDIAKLYDVSYPTVRLRLDKLIQKIEFHDKQADEPFINYISQLAIEAKVDLETAKDIIEKYKQEPKEE